MFDYIIQTRQEYDRYGLYWLILIILFKQDSNMIDIA